MAGIVKGLSCSRPLKGRRLGSCGTAQRNEAGRQRAQPGHRGGDGVPDGSRRVCRLTAPGWTPQACSRSARYQDLHRHRAFGDWSVGCAADRTTATFRILHGSSSQAVHARCNESIRERPIPVGLRFDANADPGLQESLRLFDQYGKPLVAPDGTTTFTLDLPGGLGGTPGRGSVRIGPTAHDAARGYGLRLRACRPDGTPAVVRLAMNAPTVGSRGARLSGEHDGGAFAFEALHDLEPAAMQVRFSTLDLTGKAVASVIDGVEFLLALPGAEPEVAQVRSWRSPPSTGRSCPSATRAPRATPTTARATHKSRRSARCSRSSSTPRRPYSSQTPPG